jgi:ribosomal protein L32
MRSKCEGPLGHMKHNVPDSAKLQIKESSVCETCGHMKLSHIMSCFAKGCSCKKFVVTINK